MKYPQCGEPHDLSDCPRWRERAAQAPIQSGELPASGTFEFRFRGESISFDGELYSTPATYKRLVPIAIELARRLHSATAPAAQQQASTATGNAVQQAQNWAMEAKTQRATVLSILNYFGLPEHDYEALALIKAKVKAAQEQVAIVPSVVAFLDAAREEQIIDAGEAAELLGLWKRMPAPAHALTDAIPEWERTVPLCPTEPEMIEAMEAEIAAYRAIADHLTRKGM